MVYRVDTSNFHTVLPGKVYRSGQMTEGQWAVYLQKYAIRSVLNLREEPRASGWYQGKVHAAAQPTAHVKHSGLSTNDG
jgi:hypothetical protein